MDDQLSSGPDWPPWRPSRRTIVAMTSLALAAAVVVGIVAVNRSDGSHRAASPSPSPPSRSGSAFPYGPDAVITAGQTPGLVIVGVPVSEGYTLNRRDRTADSGPWTVTVRRGDGSLGRHGAVVTFPVPAPRWGRPVQVGNVRGEQVGPGEIVWPVGGAHARVRGDLPQSELLGIAAATAVVSGRPDVRPPSGFSVTAKGSSRPTYLREARYGSNEAGEAAELGNGLTYTAVVRCGGFEDQLYYAVNAAQPAGTVHGRSAIVTSAFGGNGVLAWEPVPGVVAYVGYSGASLDEGAIGALRRIAQRTRLVSPEAWLATHPQTYDQINDFG